MGTIERSRAIDAPVDVVWAVMTDPDVYAEAASNLVAVEVLEGSEAGMVRRCVDTRGNEWTETCEYWTPGRGFGVSVDVETSDFHRRLFSEFLGHWELTERDDDVLVTIRFAYETLYGPLGWLISAYLRRAAPSIVEGIFDGWEAEVARRLEGGAHTGEEPTDRARKTA